jgi:hypothetical protein
MMATTNSDERRECVRAPLDVEVQFLELDLADYEKKRARGEVGACQGCRIQQDKWLPDGGEERGRPGAVTDQNVVDFLIHLEEKIDHLLALVARHQKDGEPFQIGHGLNISGRGMRICCDEPVEVGRILDVRARMFRFPVVILRLFAKVLRVEEATVDGQHCFKMALEFLDLDKDAEEWIISYVFQKQREAIRSAKT